MAAPTDTTSWPPFTWQGYGLPNSYPFLPSTSVERYLQTTTGSKRIHTHTHPPKKEEKTQQFRNLWGSELELPMRQPHSNMGAIQRTELFQYNLLNNFKALQNSFLLLWSIFWPNLIVHSCSKTDLTYLKVCVDRFKMVSLPCPFQTRWSVQGSMESSPALQRANALGGPGEQHPPPWPYLTPSPRAKRDRDSR